MTTDAPVHDPLLGVAVVPFFETPVVIARVADADVLIADLRPRILARMADDPGLKGSNIGGWHSDAAMLQWGGPAAGALAGKAVEIARRLTHLEGNGWDRVSWAVQMWANVSGPGALNDLHVHPANLWAAVFYVDLGAAGRAPEDAGGELYFEDPRYPAAAMHGGAFRMLRPDGQPHGWQSELRPRAGELIIFPAWLRHGVRVYRGDSQRISIAMNLDPVLGGAVKR